ncbi:MAG: hypothetical protein PHP26_05360 [Syntrophomonas sp.]|uniref:hypothetical protein n=1 Tax=Syntrophomonas sp. TaxID=2053627 RepID=UPI00260E0339|nr:hypothetical protein [Syntrophomonas sp.]MDD2509712.1 hypothetical protein [Syntrophomonas sp.]MDD3879403.1 hypothetical protein [Syntrophomonas sp.]MDD4625844.1 hypothetical protein [Syntrophomonas sp.]
MEENENILEKFGLPPTIFGTKEWQDIERKENTLGADLLLTEIIDKKIWSNEEILWVMKRLIFFYGKKDALLKKAPVERLFTNMVDILRAFYVILDISNPEIDDNMRSYISTKLADATWGVNLRTREYLEKLKD